MFASQPPPMPADSIERPARAAAARTRRMIGASSDTFIAA
jgi:hypothetical protein